MSDKDLRGGATGAQPVGDDVLNGPSSSCPNGGTAPAAGKPDFDASRRVTMETVRQLEACRAWELAAIARRYAIDRPRWWHRFTRRAAS